MPFATVATDLSTGREMWLRDGPLMSAVLASAAMPGLFPAELRDSPVWRHRVADFLQGMLAAGMAATLASFVS